MTEEKANIIAAESIAITTQCPNCGYGVQIPKGAIQLAFPNSSQEREPIAENESLRYAEAEVNPYPGAGSGNQVD